MADAMVRNRWYLPKLKSSIMSLNYMHDVRQNKTWCLKYDNLNRQPCPNPPPKNILEKEFLSLAVNNGLHTGMTDLKTPDKDWLLEAISHLKPDHEIFQKGYQPPVK
jgi:hypothetical protein